MPMRIAQQCADELSVKIPMKQPSCRFEQSRGFDLHRRRRGFELSAHVIRAWVRDKVRKSHGMELSFREMNASFREIKSPLHEMNASFPEIKVPFHEMNDPFRGMKIPFHEIEFPFREMNASLRERGHSLHEVNA